MKHIAFYKLFLIALISISIYSCKDMMETHKDYVKNGEIVYLTKFDSVVTTPGKHRVKISGIVDNGYNVTKIVVYWNNRADSLVTNYVHKLKIDPVDIIIDNLQEQVYFFDIFTVNDIGARSVKVSTSASSYGDYYQNNLIPRANIGFDYDGKLVTSNWFPANSQERGSYIRYTTNTGLDTLYLPKTATKLALPGRINGTTLDLQTVYEPEPMSIDTFLTPWTTINPDVLSKVSKVGWVIADKDSEDAVKLASFVIDGSINSYWMTSATQPNFPHWFIVDMGSQVTFSTVELNKRLDKTDGPAKFQIMYSDNGTDWSDFGSFLLDIKSNSAQKFKYKIARQSVTARYVKYIALEPSLPANKLAYLAEFSLYSSL